MKKCPECDSERIIKNAKTADQALSSQFAIAVDEKPSSIMLKQTIYSEVKVEICADCGYAAFYAADPQALWTAYQNQQNNV